MALSTSSRGRRVLADVGLVILGLISERPQRIQGKLQKRGNSYFIRETISVI